MRISHLILSLVLTFGLGLNLGSCSSTPEWNGYDDGLYCAEVNYYNPNTGTRSTYTLNVVVEDNHVVKIKFNNGGFLDGSHMTPEALSKSGTCTLITDKNYEYTVTLLDSDLQCY
jgi:hypothetical protein